MLDSAAGKKSKQYNNAQDKLRRGGGGVFQLEHAQNRFALTILKKLRPSRGLVPVSLHEGVSQILSKQLGSEMASLTH